MPWEVSVKKDATTEDTIALIINTVNGYYNSDCVRNLALQLNPTGDKYLYFKRLFHWVDTHIEYENDKEVNEQGDNYEDVYTPERTIREGKGDCKKMATLIAAVLKQVGIEPYLKHVEYYDKPYTHIYVIVPHPDLKNYVIIDPVNDHQFDKEVSHDKAQVFNLKGEEMELRQMGRTPRRSNWSLSGIGYSAATLDLDLSSTAGCQCSGVEPTPDQFERIYTELLTSDYDLLDRMLPVNTQQPTTDTREFSLGRASKEERKARREKIKDKFKNVGLALPRAAFLFIVRVNPMQLANKLANAWTKNSTAVSNFWSKIGGDPKQLKQAILSGSTVPPMPIPGVSGQTMGVITLAAVTTAIATATPILVAAKKLISDLKAAAPPGSTDQENEKAVDDLDKLILEPSENGVVEGWVDADLKSAAYSGNRPGATTAELKYDPEALLKYYADNGIDLNKVYFPPADGGKKDEEKKPATPAQVVVPAGILLALLSSFR